MLDGVELGEKIVAGPGLEFDPFRHGNGGLVEDAAGALDDLHLLDLAIFAVGQGQPHGHHAT